MAWLRKTLKHGPVRASAQTAATTSASAPTCNLASAEASFAASAAVSELAAGLDFVFDHFGDDDDPASDQFQYHLEQLCAEAEKYPGSSLMGVAGGERAPYEWPGSLSPGTCEMLRVVCQCAVMVYDQKQVVGGLKGFEIEPVLHRTPSSMGTVKASSMWKVPFTPIPGWTGKTLVVSVRGSTTIADHMVNLNGKPKDAGELFRVKGKNVTAHAGFVSCARAMLPAITDDIIQQLSADNNISNVVFTGHSAGGAVASLVFLHFAFHENLPGRLETTKLSLITFGSAPTTSSSITGLCKLRPNVNLTLSIVNEYDMISRADGPYLRSLVNLYRSRKGLPPVSLSDDQPELDAPRDTARKDIWPLPLPKYHLVGDIIVLQLLLADTPATNYDDTFSQASTITSSIVSAIELTPDEFSRLLFCDIGTHRRVTYLQRMQTLVSQACGSVSMFGESLSRAETLRTLN
ncbi:Alpha/Beta hydrolase fold [Naviculisporaceae sp. PSN 640]